MKKLESRNFQAPDEVRTFDKGKVEIINIGETAVGKATLQPGWRWSDSVKDIAKTELCEAGHFQYHVSGVLRVRMADGSEKDCTAGDVCLLPPEHDAWVVGDEPVVVIDFQGMQEYAMPASTEADLVEPKD